MKTCRFIVITDTHFFAHGNGKDGQWWHRTLHSHSQQIAKSIISSIGSLQPDFVIHCGDFTGLCDMDNFDHGKNVMDKLGCSWYVVPGNHDTWHPGVRQAISSLYDLQSEQYSYGRLINDINFLFLDTCHWATKDGRVLAYLNKELYDTGQIVGLYIPEHELQWLKEQLQCYPDKKVIIVTHVPIWFKDSYPVKKNWNGEPIKEGKLDLSCVIDPLANVEQLRKIINTSPNIIGTFSGHWHINDITVVDNRFYCMTSSLREWPFEFRLVEINDQKISITTYGLNDRELKEQSYLEELDNDWVLALTGYKPDYSFLQRLNIEIGNDLYRTPVYHTNTFETTRPGLYLAGTVCGGLKTNKWFIENGRFHARQIINHIAHGTVGSINLEGLSWKTSE